MLDESLARGLKNTLWRSAQKETKRIFDIARLKPSFPNFATRKGVRRGIDLAHKRMATPLRLVTGRSEGRKPLCWSILLTINENALVNEWHENVFGMFFGGERFLPHISRFCDLRIRICEHAILRLYQRAPQIAGLPLLDSIYPELACAGLHGFWHMAGLRVLRTKGTPYLAFVPTDTGAFLGELSTCGDFLDLRTYIAKEQMRPEQLRLWSELKALSTDENARRLFPEFMLDMGPDSEQGAFELIQSLLKVMKGFPRLLGPRPPADDNTSA